MYAYDDKNRGEVVLLRINHCIYLGNKKVDAIACPNQLRLNGIEVDERPKALFPNESHVQEICADGITFPLTMRGPLAFLHVRCPTNVELMNNDLQIITLTSPDGWDPYGIDSLRAASLVDTCPISNLLTNLFVRNLQPIQIKRKSAITPEDLVSRWGIGIETARLTLLSTYQEYTREPRNLTRRFKTSRAHSRFRTLFGPYSTFYTDTLFSKVVSLRGNTCGQVFFNKSRFYKFSPEKETGLAHNPLTTLYGGRYSFFHALRSCS